MTTNANSKTFESLLFQNRSAGAENSKLSATSKDQSNSSGRTKLLKAPPLIFEELTFTES